ncbi:hypothetical protein ACGFY7_39575 [Streptomyces prunicolor]|uniref:hypothetical protein n=1 Tax=Streptomyces prunicolor TaxID=67348 RepID=UPI00372177C8
MRSSTSWPLIAADRRLLTAADGTENRVPRPLALVLTALLLGVAALFGAPQPAQAAAGTVSAYPVPSIYPASTDYKLTVNGTSVPVTKYTGYDIAQLALGTGTATISVTKTNNTAIGAYSISPQKLGITGTVSGPTLTFTVQNDEYLIVKLDGRPNLVIAADPAETNRPATSGTGIFNVQSAPYSAQPNTGAYTTTAFQNALNLVSWTYCYGVKVGQGVYESQNKVTFQHVVVYDAAVGIGVHHKYGTASATNIKFDDIDIERLSFKNDDNRTWLAMQTGSTAGIGPVTGVTISNVRVRNAGVTAARINGLPGAPISGVSLSHIVMPGSTTGATTLSQVNLTNLSDYGSLTITP